MSGAQSWMLYGAAGHTGALIAQHGGMVSCSMASDGPASTLYLGPPGSGNPARSPMHS